MPERDILYPRGVLRVDDDDEPARLFGADGRVRDKQALVRRRAGHAHAREHARREHAVRIFEHGAAANGAGRAVDHVVDEVHAALVIEVILVDELEGNRHAGIAAGDILSAVPGEPLVAQIRRLIEGELEMDRIDRDDSGEQRCVAAGATGHKIAGRNAPVADAAIHRRAQFGEFQIEFGLTHGRLVVAHRGLGVAEGLRALLEGLVGDGLVTHQLLAARIVGLGEGHIGLRLHEIGARLIERVLEGPLVDGEQQVALLDDLPVLEMQSFEIARNARAHFD